MSAQLFKGWAKDRDIALPSCVNGDALYDGRRTDHEMFGWADLVRDVNALTGESFSPYASMWNHYADGAHGVRFHHDSAEDAIAILSLGADGEFALSACENHANITVFAVEDGDLLYLPKHEQHTYAHGVKSYGERYSLVMRTGRCTGRYGMSCRSEHDAAQERLWGDSMDWIKSMNTDDRVATEA